jgi:hypothetical protein
MTTDNYLSFNDDADDSAMVRQGCWHGGGVLPSPLRRRACWQKKSGRANELF